MKTNLKAYRLVVVWRDGREQVVYDSDNPREARAAEKRVSRNPKVIDRIELRDNGGKTRLETIWSRDWL